MMRAFYKFRFYELDQPLEVGLASGCMFFLDPHFDSATDPKIDQGMNLVFYNTLGGQRSISAMCQIIKIWHPELGSVDKIDTDGLDYKVTLSDGSVVEINAEEDPGKCIDQTKQPQDWVFLVDLEPITAQQGAQLDAFGAG